MGCNEDAGRKKWEKEDVALLRSMKESGAAIDVMVAALGRSKNSIECRLRREFPMDRSQDPDKARRPWPKEDLEELARLVGEGFSVDQLCEHFGRSRNAIEVRVNRIGAQLKRPHRNWLPDEDAAFSEDWQDGSMSLSKLLKKYDRPWFSLRKRAQILELGPRPYDCEYVSVADICREMQVSHDRVYSWFHLGLKRRKNRSGKTKWVVDISDLLAFLEQHQYHFEADKVSRYLFPVEPEWLVQKRKHDININKSRNRYEWTNEEDKRMVREFSLGKSDQEIAEILHRTVSGVAGRRHVLGLMKDEYLPDEIEILKNNSRYLTVLELSKLIRRKSPKSIEYMCGKLGLPYHLSKDRCEER